MTMAARQIVFAARPKGKPQLTDFRLEETAIPAPAAEQVLLQVQYLSLDPYMRGRMDDRKSYAKPLQVGDVMVGETVAKVIASKHPRYAEGDLVLAHTGWRTHALSEGAGLSKVDPALAPVSTRLGVLGMPGFTAYGGMRAIGKPLLNKFARVPVSGLIAQYNGPPPGDGTDRLPATMREILSKSLTVRGFINYDFAAEHYADFLREVGAGIADGSIRYREDIVEGLEKAPEAFIGMLDGRNFGKVIVRVGI